MIKNILFDLDDTILDFKKSEKLALQETLKAVGIEPNEEIISTYSSINDNQWKLLEKGLTNREKLKQDRFRLLFEHYSFDKDYTLASILYPKKLSEESHYLDGAKEMLAAFKGNYHIYLVSNGNKDVQVPRLRKAGLSTYFENSFISEEIGYSKPSKEYFDYVFAHIPNFQKEETIIIGDSLTSDIQGGINAGIKTIWFNPSHKETSLSIDYIVSTHQEIIDIITKLSQK